MSATSPAANPRDFRAALLRPEMNERKLVDAAAHGVGLEGLALHRDAFRDPPGVVLGYGNLAEPAIERAVRLIAQSVD
jgi:hypothetical protein